VSGLGRTFAACLEDRLPLRCAACSNGLMRRSHAVLVLPCAAAVATQDRSSIPSSAEAPSGSPAPESIVAEIRLALDAAISRFTEMDETGVLAYVSPQYRTGALTKAGIAEQLRAVFAIHDQVRARVRIDDVRMVGELAWVYSTGDVTGRLRWVGGSVPVLSWQRELEVARRENGRWRLYGYQQ
jgi:hypothetical protein